MPAAISIAPVVNKHREAGETTSSVASSELMAVLVPDSRLWEVSGEPVRVVEGFVEYLEICNLLSVHCWIDVVMRAEDMG
jgi:hypothetical protein